MYREFFYWLYMFYSKRKRFKGDEISNAIHAITILQTVKIVSFVMIINYYYPFIHYLLFKPEEGKRSLQNWILPILTVVPIYIYNYFHLYEKQKEIIQYYKNKQMTQSRKKWGILLFWLYVITSGIIFFGVAYAFRQNK